MATPDIDDGHVAAPLPDPLLGTCLHGRYEVEQELGWGSLGRVYLARDLLRDPGRDRIAIKVIRRDRLTPAAIAYLKLEFRFLSGMRHPHVAEVYDLDVVPGGGDGQDPLLFFTEEYLPGETLVAATRRLGWEPSLELFVQTLRALAFVHAHGLIHMDIKPQNVLVLEQDGARRVRVLDFHLAREQDGGRARTMRGTIAYMPPEVIKGEQVDVRADLYSLGAVVYEALTGSAPFADAGNPMDILRAHANAPPPSFAERGTQVPPALEAIVMRLLAKRPADRFPSANEAIRAVNTGLNRSFALETEETRESYLDGGRLVGRTQEVEQVLAAARGLLGAPLDTESAYDSSTFAHPIDPRVFRIFGEPGIGKSRFLSEVKVALQLEGLPCLLVRPRRVDAVPYGPFLDALGELLRRTGRGELLRRVSRDGRSVDPELLAAESPSDLPPRLRRTAALADLLREVALECPFALALDDYHLVDEATRELARALVGRPRARALLLLADGDPETRTDDAEAVAGVTSLQLNCLTRAATGALLQSMVHATGVPEPFVAKVWEVTGGNPRFVEETMRSLAETGAIQTREGILAVTEEAAPSLLPEVSLGELTGQRVARLDADAAALLGSLAVSPRPRSLPFAGAVAGLPLPKAKAAFRELERRGFVSHQRESETPGIDTTNPVLLEHEPLRAAVIERLGPVQVEAMHVRAAQLIESRHPVTLEGPANPAGGDRAEELLWHMERAGRIKAAFRYATQAAQAARRKRGHLRARALYQRSLDLFDALEAEDAGGVREPSHMTLTLRLAESLAATGERERALELLRPLTEPLPRSAEGLRLRAAMRKDHGDFQLAQQDLERAIACADEALAQGDPAATLERARCLAERATVHLWTADYRAVLRDGEEALTVFRALEERDRTVREDLVRVADTLYHASRFLGEEDQATEFLQAGLEAQGGASGEWAQEELTPRHAKAALKRALQRGHAPLLGDASGAHVPRTILEAAFQRADRGPDLAAHYRRRCQLLEAAGDRDGEAFAQLNLGHLRRARGRMRKALHGYERARERFEQSDNRVGLALVHLSRARLLAELGDADQAQDEAERAERSSAALGARWIEAQARLAQAGAERARGAFDAAGAALLRAEQLTRELHNVPQQAEQALFRSELALDRDPPDAEAAKTSLATFRSLPAGARSLAQRIRALLVEAAAGLVEGDLNTASDLARQALDEAELRGLAELAWRAAWLRARVRRAQEDTAAELDDLVTALSILREVSSPLPTDLRRCYLSERTRGLVRARFGELQED